jgi:hypothetical protein
VKQEDRRHIAVDFLRDEEIPRRHKETGVRGADNGLRLGETFLRRGEDGGRDVNNGFDD